MTSAPVNSLKPAPGRPPALCLGPTLTISPPIILAPMSGLTNLPLRTLVEELGCGLTITEFIAAIAMAHGVRKEMKKLTASEGGRQFGVQIFGRVPALMHQGAKLALEAGADLVDINMGCPAKKVVKGMSGAALMREPALAADLVRAVVDARDEAGSSSLVTVKIRAGWDEQSKNAPEFAARMVEAGAQAVTVHGRTREQSFGGKVDYQIIRAVKEAVSVPVIGNGDIVDLASLEQMFADTGCDGAMIGRAALGNPWIFAAAAAWWSGQELPPPPTPRDRADMYLRHLAHYLKIAPDSKAVLEMRKFAAWYFRGFAGATTLRKTINTLTEIEEVRALVTQAAQNWPL